MRHEIGLEVLIVLQAMVDSDLPAELRNTWQIELNQLQLVLDGQKKPVTLGKGAYGTVSAHILPMSAYGTMSSHDIPKPALIMLCQELHRSKRSRHSK